MRDHASVNYVFFNNQQWQVKSYSTERRPNGNTSYALVPVGKPNERPIHVNAIYCEPFVPSGGFIPKDADLSLNLKGYEFGQMKTKPVEITEEQIDDAISKSVVYQEAVKALREQVAYGLRKYPEPLQYTTWDFKESIKHALSENSDRQHYLTMMLINADFLMHIDDVIDLLVGVYSGDNLPYSLHNQIEKLKHRKRTLVDKYSTPNPID